MLDYDLMCTDIDVNEEWLKPLDFRNYNELPHIASQRLYLALNDAVNFSNSFKRIEYDTIQRFLIFLIGSVTSFL